MINITNFLKNSFRKHHMFIFLIIGCIILSGSSSSCGGTNYWDEGLDFGFFVEDRDNDSGYDVQESWINENMVTITANCHLDVSSLYENIEWWVRAEGQDDWAISLQEFYSADSEGGTPDWEYKTHEFEVYLPNPVANETVELKLYKKYMKQDNSYETVLQDDITYTLGSFDGGSGGDSNHAKLANYAYEKATEKHEHTFLLYGQEYTVELPFHVRKNYQFGVTDDITYIWNESEWEDYPLLNFLPDGESHISDTYTHYEGVAYSFLISNLDLEYFSFDIFDEMVFDFLKISKQYNIHSPNPLDWGVSKWHHYGECFMGFNVMDDMALRKANGTIGDSYSVILGFGDEDDYDRLQWERVGGVSCKPFVVSTLDQFSEFPEFTYNQRLQTNFYNAEKGYLVQFYVSPNTGNEFWAHDALIYNKPDDYNENTATIIDILGCGNQSLGYKCNSGVRNILNAKKAIAEGYNARKEDPETHITYHNVGCRFFKFSNL